jgi:hypothetical protein
MRGFPAHLSRVLPSSAFCSLAVIDPKLLKQSGCVLMMVQNLANPGIVDVTVESVCPDLDLELILSILKSLT